MHLLIVIVNYRTPELTVDCLRSLQPQVVDVDAHVIVTDGASGDHSVKLIGDAIAQHGWSHWAKLMPLEHNGGFAYGNNAAIAPALKGADRPDYVLLLNPDTIVRPGAIQALTHFMDAHPHVGIAGSRLESMDAAPQCSAFRFPTIFSEFENGMRLGMISRLLRRYVVAPPVRDVAHQTDWVAGASMIVRTEVFDAIGLLDDGYFMYYEEVDFCLRARRAGWPCWYVPQSRIVHLVGQASGVTDVKQRKRRPAYWFNSRQRYFTKNHSPAYAQMADLAWMMGYATWRLRRWMQRKEDTDSPHLLGDFLSHALNHARSL